jgi:(p)ppGpp synthase/HD superfamily hydrolase
MSQIERALQIAVEAHAGQTDKSGLPYAFHPIRVMLRCKSDEAKIAALLHDVVEDTPVSLDQLSKEGFSEDILAAVRLLTHEPAVSYEDYIRQLGTNQIAKEVKLADLEDNSDIKRMKSVDEKAVGRLRKYLFAYRYLTGAAEGMTKSE